MRLRRVRLRRTWNVAEQFLLAATAQNRYPYENPWKSTS
jgi:hypothetical protein